jgi:hypothetical protein
MGDFAYDLANGVTIRCEEVDTDTLHLHMGDAGHTGSIAWFAANTTYPNTRITICPTRADLEKLHAAIGKALGK